MGGKKTRREAKLVWYEVREGIPWVHVLSRAATGQEAHLECYGSSATARQDISPAELLVEGLADVRMTASQAAALSNMLRKNPQGHTAYLWGAEGVVTQVEVWALELKGRVEQEEHAPLGSAAVEVPLTELFENLRAQQDGAATVPPAGRRATQRTLR